MKDSLLAFSLDSQKVLLTESLTETLMAHLLQIYWEILLDALMAKILERLKTILANYLEPKLDNFMGISLVQMKDFLLEWRLE